MPTLADSLASSSARKINVRVRPDLSAERIRYQAQYYWVVKDPLALNYFRLHEEEYAILQMLDGETSADDIKARFELQFRPQKIALEEIAQFVGMLHRNGLVIADTLGQGGQLHKRAKTNKRKERLSRWTNVLSIRFKGIDPDRLLNWMYPYVKWFFTPAAAFCCLILGLSAATLVAVQFDVFQSKLLAFHDFFAARNWIWLAVALGVTKIIHEFGHGLMAKHFGGECHEMGVLLLVLTPCLYCNVTDSWMLKSKWQRAAIGAGGMYIELVMASIATFIWWFSEPGLLNQICLSVMFVSSVSTVMFNANPLLRYDGYYILCDLMEIPNLRQKSSTVLNRKMGKWLLGLEEPVDPFLPKKNQVFFAIYAVASSVYSWLVVLSILWFLNQAFGPELKVLGQIIALAALYGLIVMPLWKLAKFFYVPGRLDKVKKPQMYGSLAVLTGIVLFVLLVPLPYHVQCILEVKPRGAEPVYVSVPGTLSDIEVRPGQKVRAGDTLARLADIDLKIAVEELRGQRDGLRARLTDVERRRFSDAKAAGEVEQVRESFRAVEEQLEEKMQDEDRLTLKAPLNGTVLPPPSIKGATADEDRLSTWSGTPLQEKNEGALLQKRDLFCYVGEPRNMEAILIVDQADIDFVHTGQRVEIKLETLPHDTLSGEIVEIAELDLQATPLQLSSKSGGPLITETDAEGNERPVSASYQARVPLEDPEGVLISGLTGQAKVRVGSQTLGYRFWRYLSRTFNFELN